MFTPTRIVHARFVDAVRVSLDPGVTSTVEVVCTSRRTIETIEFPANAAERRNVDRSWGALRDGGDVDSFSVAVGLGALSVTLPLDPSWRDADARLFAFLPSLLSDLDRAEPAR